MLILLAAIGCARCGAPPPHPAAADDPSLKPPVRIITPDGNTVTCQAGPGAVCVQP